MYKLILYVTVADADKKRLLLRLADYSKPQRTQREKDWVLKP